MTTDAPREMDLRDAFFGTIHEIARQDPSVLFMTADMGAWSLSKFREELPKQFMNVGISEQNMVSVGAGLALTGRRVFMYAIAPFLALRCLEQIKVDCCLMNLPVTLVGGGPGFTYAPDGPTHHAIEDIAVIRALPGMTIFCPSDPTTAEAAARLGYRSEGPTYVRVDKGAYPFLHDGDLPSRTGVVKLGRGKDVLLISCGTIVREVLRLATILGKRGIRASVLELLRVKPLDKDAMLRQIRQHGAVVTIEEHSIIGGIGSVNAELLVNDGEFRPLRRYGVPDEYPSKYSSRGWLRHHYRLDVDSLATDISPRFARIAETTAPALTFRLKDEGTC